MPFRSTGDQDWPTTVGSRRSALHHSAVSLLTPRAGLYWIYEGPGEHAVDRACYSLGDNLFRSSIRAEENTHAVANGGRDHRSLGQFQIERGLDRFFEHQQHHGERRVPRRSRGSHRPWPRSRHRRSRRRSDHRGLLVRLVAIASAVLKPMPRMSRAKRYGFSVMTWTASEPYVLKMRTALLLQHGISSQRNTMISLIFCSAQAVSPARAAPMPVTSRSRPGSSSISFLLAERLHHLLRVDRSIPRIIPEP